MRILVFLFVISVVMGSLHYYVWMRLVRDPKLPPTWRKALTALLIALFVSLIASLLGFRFVSRSTAAPLSWVGFTWLGTIFLLAVSVAIFDLARFVRMRASPPKDPERRLAITRMFAGAAAVVGLGESAVGFASVALPVSIKKVRVVIDKLDPTHTGYRIAQLTDVHVGPTIGKHFIADVVNRTNALNADLVVITGDLVDGTVEELREHVAPLADLKAKDGVFFVTGNHEYYSGVEDWVAHLQSMRIRCLRNEHVKLGAFDLAGIDDISSHVADLDRALLGRDPNRACVLLAHQPKGIERAAAAGVDLQLSGHTHGGQLFPWGLLVRLQQPFVQGLHTLAKAQIYVSRGTGYWGPPMRFLAPSEITEIELVSA